MVAAVAPVPESSLAAHRNAIQVEVVPDDRIGAEIVHDCTPLRAVRFDPTTPESQIDDVMRDFMHDSVTNVFLEITGKDPWVEAKLSLLVPDAVHARGGSGQVEYDGYDDNAYTVSLARLLQSAPDFGLHDPSPPVVERLQVRRFLVDHYLLNPS
jgi:hypothetical protein